MPKKKSAVEKERTYRQTWIVLLSIVGFVLILALIVFTASRVSAEDIAFINIEAGKVEVNTGTGWKEAIDGMALSLKDMVRTGDDGEASVILYDSAIISLSPNTEIKLADIKEDTAIIEQSSGSTWNKFLGLTGLKGMEVETPTTVAAVRGTEFGIDITDEEEALLVAEGEVMFGMKADMELVSAKQGEKLVLRKELAEDVAAAEALMEEGAELREERADLIQERIEKRIKREPLTEEDRERMARNVIKSIDRMKKVRRLMVENRPLLKKRLEIKEAEEAQMMEAAKATADYLGAIEERRAENAEFVLDKLATLDAATLKMIEQRAAQGNPVAERILLLKRLREAEGMEKVNIINDHIQEQLKLINELQQHEDMGMAVQETLAKPAFQDILNPIVEADKVARADIEETGLLTEEELQQLRADRQMILEPLVQQKLLEPQYIEGEAIRR